MEGWKIIRYLLYTRKKCAKKRVLEILEKSSFKFIWTVWISVLIFLVGMTSVFLAICLEDLLQFEEIPRLALSVCLNSHISDQIVSQLKRKWNWFHINIKPFWISSFDLYLNSVSAYNRNRSGTEQRAHDFSSCSIKLAFSVSKLLLERFNSSFSLSKRVFALVCPVAKISRFWIIVIDVNSKLAW